MRTYEYGLEELRHIVNNYDFCVENFISKFSVEDLIKIHRAWMKSDWDIYPDQWTDRQVKEALLGMAPNWDENENPIY